MICELHVIHKACLCVDNKGNTHMCGACAFFEGKSYKEDVINANINIFYKV